MTRDVVKSFLVGLLIMGPVLVFFIWLGMRMGNAVPNVKPVTIEDWSRNR